MKAHVVSLINAISLIALGTWSYLSSQAYTALIPVVFGVILLGLNHGVKKENKILAHLAVLFTALILFGLFKPLTGQIDKGSTLGILRVGLMMATTVWALVAFVQSFISARRLKAA